MSVEGKGEVGEKEEWLLGDQEFMLAESHAWEELETDSSKSTIGGEERT